MYWCPKVCIYTQKSTRFWKVYLNYSKCTWKISILLCYHQTIIESCATRHSAVSSFTETVEFLARNLASMRMRYCCSMIGCSFFLDIIGSQKRIAAYNLLAAGNDKGNQFIMVSEDRDNHICCRAFGTTCFYDLCRGLDSNIQPSACEANALTCDCATAVVVVLS